MASSSAALSVFRWLGDEVGYRILAGLGSILRALPPRWIPALGTGLGSVLYAVDGRGRRVGRENLRVVFGDALGDREKRAILLASFRNSVRSIALLLHVAPMTRERLLRWIDVTPDIDVYARRVLAGSKGLVVVSGHVGSWELLLGLPSLFDDVPRMTFLAEGFAWEPLDRWLASLRGTGGGSSVMREGGARALNSDVRHGGIAALLTDRNVRSWHGGRWAPFLGLRARTTPLPAWLAVRNDVPVIPVLCLPTENGRYRLWAGPDLAAGVDRSDPDRAVQEITARINETLSAAIRAQPEVWNWTLKRFKSRPHRELGPYPSYSLWDDVGAPLRE